MNRRNNLKKAVTLSALVIYVMLFTTFTIFASNISTSINEKMFNDRGQAYSYSQLNKLEYNLEMSARESNDVIIQDRKIIFSNGDEYEYNYLENILSKNSGKLCDNIELFDIDIGQKENKMLVNINVKFKKYLKELNRNIIIYIGGNR